jgi:hypothetical protein
MIRQVTIGGDTVSSAARRPAGERGALAPRSSRVGALPAAAR